MEKKNNKIILELVAGKHRRQKAEDTRHRRNSYWVTPDSFLVSVGRFVVSDDRFVVFVIRLWSSDRFGINTCKGFLRLEIYRH